MLCRFIGIVEPFVGILSFVLFTPILLCAQPRPSTWETDWKRVQEAAKHEGKVIVSIPASAELRKGIEENFVKRYGLGIELVPSRAAAVVRKILDESKAGIHSFDLHLGGSESIVTGLLAEEVLERFEPWVVLPTVNDPKNWWGGHVWVDNAKRYAYSFVADQTQNIWYDTSSVKPEEIRSYDNLLDLKWKGRIGFLDPRTPGSGASMWSFLWQLKGEEYLKKLVGQQLVLGRDQRLLAENLAKGKVSLTIGLSFYSFVSFIKAGLPVRALPNPKEGTYVSSSSGNVVVLKSAPHPNGAKLFVNWLLSKEGQEVFSKALGQGTRRLDVDTKWLKDIGVHAAKDTLTLDEYYQLENQSENKVLKIRKPAAIVARNLLD